MERELGVMTRRDLIRLASDLKIAGRHRMNKEDLVRNVLLARVYRLLPEAPELLHGLTRQNLLRMCEWIGIEAGKGAPKDYLIERIRAQKEAREPDETPAARGLPSAGQGERERPSVRETIDAHRPPMVDGALPEGYGETRIVLLPVDPYLVHVYWEVSEVDLRRAKSLFRDGSSTPQAVLRFHDVTAPPLGGLHAAGSFDVGVRIEANNWYVRLLSPERAYIVDLGLRGGDGRFCRIARSNRAGTPRAWPSQEAGGPLMRVVAFEGALRADSRGERRHVFDSTPMSDAAGQAPGLRADGSEGRRAVMGMAVKSTLPSEAASTPEGGPHARGPMERPAERSPKRPGTEFGSEGPGGTIPIQAQEKGQAGGPARQNRGPGGPGDPGEPIGTGREVNLDRREGFTSGEEEVQSESAAVEKLTSAGTDLSVSCEAMFVSGLSSREPASAAKKGDPGS